MVVWLSGLIVLVVGDVHTGERPHHLLYQAVCDKVTLSNT